MYQVFLSNTNNFKTDLFDLEMLPLPGQNGPGSDGNEGVPNYTQISLTRASPSDTA